jgi:transcriptional regulator with XRE-family HTH domain
MLKNMSELKMGSSLKKLMNDGRHTITSMSKATGVPKSTISEWLNNRAPNPVFAARVAKHLGVSLHYLLFGEEDSSEPLHRLLKEELFSGTFEINVRRVKVQKSGGQDGV